MTSRLTREARTAPFRPAAAPAGAARGGPFGRTPFPFVQSKLTVGPPGDRFEQEADRVADQVAGHDNTLPPPPITAVEAHGGRPVRRLAAGHSPFLDDREFGDEDAPPDVQTLAADPADSPAPAPAGWEGRLAAAGGGGEPLAPADRRDLGRRMGADFAAVRVHRDAAAARLAADLHARAFAHGRDVYFAPGEYRPDSPGGRRVLAHELTHVVQQGAAPRTAAGATPDPGSAAPAAAPAPRVQRMAALDPAHLTRHNVYPWGAGGASGDDYDVETDAGTTTHGWAAYSPVSEPNRYWCHGLSLGTYAAFGYSVYSGDPLRAVLADEWRAVAPAAVRAGDIAVWLPDPATAGALGYHHSCAFANVHRPPGGGGGGIDEAATDMLTKNGSDPLAVDTLTNIMAVYGSNYECYRRS